MFSGKISAAVIIGAAFLVATSVQASPVNYSFTQNGWTDKSGDTGTLNVTFSGSIEGNGDILLPDLTAFQADFQESTNGQTDTFVFNLPTTTDFSYNTNTGALNFAAGSAAAGVELCSGPDTQSSCNSPGTTTGFFEDLPDFGPFTTGGASAVNGDGPTPTPEPKSGGLIAAAGAMLLGFGCVRRRTAKSPSGSVSL